MLLSHAGRARPRRRVRPHLVHVRARQPLDEQVANQAWVGARARPAVAQDQVARQAQVGRRDRRGARVIGLNAAEGDDAVGRRGARLGHEKLQLAHLVAGQLHAGQVVALDPQLGAVRQAGHVPAVQRRGQQAQPVALAGLRCGGGAAAAARCVVTVVR